MQLLIEIQADLPVSLPFSYYSWLSAAMYHSMGAVHPEFAAHLHDGDEHKNRIKLFGFTPLHSREMEVHRGGPGSHHPPETEQESSKRPHLRFKGRTAFRLFSPWPELVNAVGEGLLTQQVLSLNGSHFHIRSVTMLPPPRFKETMTWMPAPNGSIVTSWKSRATQQKIYFMPSVTAAEDGHSAASLLVDNLIHKWQRLTDPQARPDIAARWAEVPEAEVKGWIKSQNISVRLPEKFKTRLHQVKTMPVRSWSGPIEVTAPVPIQRLIWSCGLGEMNSMGFGGMTGMTNPRLADAEEASKEQARKIGQSSSSNEQQFP
jgi:CRISPR/Cas system endoribonuclease Cas6 (RAMP superfamily)